MFNGGTLPMIDSPLPIAINKMIGRAFVSTLKLR